MVKGKELTHLDKDGVPTMVDVGEKHVTKRQAEARSVVYLGEKVLSYLTEHGFATSKGPVFQTAIIAGTMAVKRTDTLIPLCHSIPIESCSVTIQPLDSEHIDVRCIVSCRGKTGVEMEALTGASIAALTVYDMCKAMGHEMRIVNTQLIRKVGGKRDYHAQ